MSNQQASLTMPINEPVWYKQFWPWFLIILPGTVVIASIITVVIAFKSADTLVADNYYKEGMAINKTVSDLNAAKTINLHGTLNFTGNSLNLSITGNHSVEDQQLLILFSHPLDNLQDQAVHLQKTANGEYTGKLPTLSAGKWYIAVQSLESATPWRINLTGFLPAAHIEIHAQ